MRSTLADGASRLLEGGALISADALPLVVVGLALFEVFVFFPLVAGRDGHLPLDHFALGGAYCRGSDGGTGEETEEEAFDSGRHFQSFRGCKYLGMEAVA